MSRSSTSHLVGFSGALMALLILVVSHAMPQESPVADASAGTAWRLVRGGGGFSSPIGTTGVGLSSSLSLIDPDGRLRPLFADHDNTDCETPRSGPPRTTSGGAQPFVPRASCKTAEIAELLRQKEAISTGQAVSP